MQASIRTEKVKWIWRAVQAHYLFAERGCRIAPTLPRWKMSSLGRGPKLHKGGGREDYNWFSLPTNTSTAPRNGNQQRTLILAEAEPMWKADPRSGRASDRRNQRVELGFACDLSSVSATGKLYS